MIRPVPCAVFLLLSHPQKSMILMRLVSATPCPRRLPDRGDVNLVANPHFEGIANNRKMGQLAAAKDWDHFGEGFEVRRMRAAALLFYYLFILYLLFVWR